MKSGTRVQALTTSLKFEKKLGYPNLLIAGVDEVGRGCLAGPVVAAALILPLDIDYRKARWLSEVTDSKALTAEARERLAPQIETWALSTCVASASVEEIDRLNIYHASHLAMFRALQGLSRAPEHVLVDGNVVPKAIPFRSTAVVKGDLKCLSIAAASILAKVWRDRHMQELDAQYPGYGLAQHKGYGTPVHQAALKKLGCTDIHRRSFAPVAEASQVAFVLP